jgi:cysteinyl-tRNA synthetase
MLLCLLSFQAVSEVKARFLGALSDDFDTSKAMSAIIQLVGVTNKMLHRKPEHVSIFYIYFSALYIYNTKDVQ